MRREAYADCPDENALSEFLAGASPAERVAELERHVAACEACGGLIAELAHGSAAVSSQDATEDAASGANDLATLEKIDPARFTIRREIARGGMGRIVEAWDRRHSRVVAIKFLLQRGSAAARARFVREGRVTARLQHPGVIPLYEAGRWSDDEPLLVMKLVAGEPLDDVIRAATRLEDRLLLLPNMIAVTDALAYAHEHGVVHRDLKPSNILVGEFGETVVIDWGLAKIMGDGDGDTGVESDDPAAPKADDSLTQAGSTVGTPAYMPPEQARGGAIDARADVYALGALLYHVLSGGPPYAGGSSKQTLALVLAGPPRPLPEVAPAVPRDLATLVAKAMARDPADRYADARAMATDLRRFVNGQLVSAHEYSPGALVRRWVARYRGILATAAVLLAVLAVTSAFAIRRVVRERDRADALKVAADRERSTALTQRDAAESLVGFVIGQLRERLEALGKLDLLAGVGSEVGSYYSTLGTTDEAPGAAPLRRRGLALLALVEVEAKKRSYEAATTLARSAVEVLETAQRTAPGDVESGALLAVARATLVGVRSQAGHGDDALAEAKHAEEAAATLVKGGSVSDGRAWLATAFVESRLGMSRADHADVEGARASEARAREDIANAGDVGALDVFWQDILGTTYRNLGGIATRTQDWAGMVEVAGAGIAHRRRQLAAEPDHVEHLNAMAYLLRGLSFAEEKLGRGEAALQHARESIALRSRILQLEPEDATAKYDQGIALAMTCDLERAWHGAKAAEADCLAARAILEAVMAARPNDGKVEDAMGRSLRALGRMYLAEHRGDDAVRAFQAAIDVAERAAARDPGSFLLATQVTLSLSGKADVELRTHRLDAARADALDALARDEKQRDAHPNVGFFDEDLGERFAMLGDVEHARGDGAAANRDYAEAVAHLERAVAADPGDSDAAVDLAGICVHAAAAATGSAERAAFEARARALSQPLDGSGRLSPEQRANLHLAP